MNETLHSEITMSPSTGEDRMATLVGGSALEGFGALAAMALAIVGLAGILPPIMAAIATIVLGAAALVEGGAFEWGTTRTSDLRFSHYWFEGTSRTDLQGGFATLVLGVLALLGIAPLTLLSVGIIALGATFVLSGRLFIGLGSVVLGILAVVGFSPWIMVLAGLLSLGGGLLFSGWGLAVRAGTVRS